MTNINKKKQNKKPEYLVRKENKRKRGKKEEETKEKGMKFLFDEMWSTICNMTDKDENLRFPKLSELLSLIRTLSNSNSDPERAFSMLTDVKTLKRNKLLPGIINAICVLKDTLRSAGTKAQIFKIDEEHLRLMKSSNLYSKEEDETTNDGCIIYPS